MEGNIVSAAKWFGFSLIISSIILVVGFNMTMSMASGRISTGLTSAGANARSQVSIPSAITLRHYPQGQFQVGIGNRGDDAVLNID